MWVRARLLRVPAVVPAQEFLPLTFMQQHATQGHKRTRSRPLDSVAQSPRDRADRKKSGQVRKRARSTPPPPREARGRANEGGRVGGSRQGAAFPGDCDERSGMLTLSIWLRSLWTELAAIRVHTCDRSRGAVPSPCGRGIRARALPKALRLHVSAK